MSAPPCLWGRHCMVPLLYLLIITLTRLTTEQDCISNLESLGLPWNRRLQGLCLLLESQLQDLKGGLDISLEDFTHGFYLSAAHLFNESSNFQRSKQKCKKVGASLFRVPSCRQTDTDLSRGLSFVAILLKHMDEKWLRSGFAQVGEDKAWRIPYCCFQLPNGKV